MGRKLDRDAFERLRVGRAEQSSRRAFLGQLGKTATALTLGGVLSEASPVKAGAASASIFNVPPYATLAPHGGDVTYALNQIIAAVPDGSLIQFPVSDRYRVDGTVCAKRKTGLTLEFNGSTLWTADSTPFNNPTTDRIRSHLRLNSCSTVHVNHLTIAGPKPMGASYNAALEGQAGIDVQSSADVHIANYNCSSVWGDGLQVTGYGSSWATPTDISMTLFQIDDAGRDGIATSSVDGLTISYGVFSDIGRTVFDMEPNNSAEVIQNVWMHDVRLTDHELNFVAAAGIGTLDSVTIENITAVGCTVGSIFAADHGASRNNIVMRNMTSDTQTGNFCGAALPFVAVPATATQPPGTCGNITVAGINQPLQIFPLASNLPPMQIARFWNCTRPFTLDGNQPKNQNPHAIPPPWTG